jgi:hypothetical protein
LIDLQDARIHRAAFDEGSGVVTIELVLATKKRVCLMFEGVRPSPHIAAMLKLGGTILDWKPSAGPGNTHIYLMDGVITLHAQRLSLRT